MSCLKEYDDSFSTNGENFIYRAKMVILLTLLIRIILYEYFFEQNLLKYHIN